MEKLSQNKNDLEGKASSAPLVTKRELCNYLIISGSSSLIPSAWYGQSFHDSLQTTTLEGWATFLGTWIISSSLGLGAGLITKGYSIQNGK